VRIAGGARPAHHRDLVIDRLGVRAEEGDVLVALGECHPHEAAPELLHHLEVADIQADMAQAFYACGHGDAPLKKGRCKV
jgi:hypothetical protein